MRKVLTVILSIVMVRCALPPRTEAGFSGTDLLLPSVGRGPGASSSQWTTTVWIANPSSSTANVQVMFLERKQANPAPVTVTISVPAGDTVRYANILADLFAFDNKFGALRFVSDQKIVVSCRIFNLPAGGADRDTQGQDYSGTPASFGISKGQSTQLLGVYQTSTDRSASAFRYSFGWAESAGGTASVHVKAYDGTGAIVAEKDYGPFGAYEVWYYPIEDLSPSISSQNLRLEVSMTDGTGKIMAVGSGVANQSNDGTTFEMQFADSLLGGGGGGLSAVIHDATLAGDGTAASPLGLANNGVTASKVAPVQLVKSINGLKDDVTIAAGPNITLTPSGNTLTIASTGGGGGGGGSGVPSVNGITSAVTINGTGASSVSTAGSTITVNSPSSLSPSGAAGGSLAGTYPNPAIATGAVGTTQIADLAVTDAKVGKGIDYAKLFGTPTSLPPSGTAGGSLAGAYPNPAIAKFAVTTTELADGAITDAKVSKSGIDYAKLLGAPTSLPPSGAAGGDLTGVYPKPAIALGVVGTAQIADLAITDAKVSKTGIDYAKLFGAPTSLPPNGAAGGSLSGTYPNPGIAAGQVVKSLNALKDDVTLAAGTNITLTPTGNTLTIASTGGGTGVPSVNGITGAVTINGTGATTVSTAASTITVNSPSSLPPSGAAGGDLSGTYPNPTLKLPYSGTTTSVTTAFAVINSGGGNGVGGTSSSGYGVFGQSTTGGAGVYGLGTSSHGVSGTSGSAFSAGVYGSHSGGGYAGYFSGNVNVAGTLFKAAGSFKIDHPLDPEHKYLYHSFVESPDMMNIYNGNVTTDANGEAIVDLPAWFEALNRDFRYQLTAIGVPGPNLYVAEEIAGGRFKIAGGKPGAKVSWQVTGIRKDPFAEKHRIPVEEDKPAIEQGSYLHPDAYGQPEEKSVEWATRPEMMRRMKAERESAAAAKP